MPANDYPRTASAAARRLARRRSSSASLAAIGVGAAFASRLVGRVKSLEDSRRDRDRDPRLDPLAPLMHHGEELRQRLPVNVLHVEEDLALRLDDVERLYDMGVLNPGREAGLVEEHFDELGIPRDMRMEPLDRDGA